MSLDGGFELTQREGRLDDLVAADLSSRRRVACVVRPTERGVVLGSSQRVNDIDEEFCRGMGYAIVRRRSGGGAVVVADELCVWLDLFVPVGDELWVADVGRAAWWVGEVWATALSAVLSGPAKIEVHKGSNLETAWSRRLCFSGLGPGEVTVDGRKVVGVSQRRDRLGARFFSMALVGFDPTVNSRICRLSPRSQSLLAAALETSVGVAGTDRDLLEQAVLFSLSRFGAH